MVTPTNSSIKRRTSLTNRIGVLALVLIAISLAFCWGAPLERGGSDAGPAGAYDMLFRVLGTIALVPIVLIAALYVVVGRRQKEGGPVTGLGLFVGALSALFAGLLLSAAFSFHQQGSGFLRFITSVIATLFGSHAVWTLVRWRGEGNVKARRKALRWIGVGLIGLGGMGAMSRWLEGCTPKVTLTSYRARIAAVTIDADGRQVATVDAKGKLVLWDVATGGARWSSLRDLAKSAGDVVFSPDGRRLLSREPAGLMVFDALTGKILHSLPSR